ncbi:MAG: hypothetical protein SOR57_06900 [Parabacteroides sp.]|nr:hypothetical protein [Parabacteroides sp.]
MEHTDYYYILGMLLCFTIAYLVWLVYLIFKIKEKRGEAFKKAQTMSYPAASAGSGIEGKNKEEISISTEINHFYSPEGKEINASDYDHYVASGNSMILCGIQDKDLLFVKKNFNVGQLIDLPKILVIERHNAKPEEIQYKIRRTWKICSFADNLECVINELLESASFRKLAETEQCPDNDVLIDDFFEKRLIKYRSEYPDCDNVLSEYNRVVISTTLHTNINEVRFSIHPLKDVRGVVEYSFAVSSFVKGGDKHGGTETRRF